MRGNRVLAFTAVLSLVVAACAAAVVVAQTPRAGKGRLFGMRRAWALGYVAHQLNLSSDQRQQIKQIVASHKDEIKAAVDQAFAARRALRQAIAGGNADAIAAAARQVSAAQVKGAQVRAQLRARIYGDVLQPDQRAKADQLLARWEQKADQRHQRFDRWIDRFSGSGH